MSANKLTTPIATINLIACLRFEVAAIGSVFADLLSAVKPFSGYRTSSIRSLVHPRALVVVIGRAYACRAGEFTYLTVRTSVEQSQVFLKTDQATIETLQVFDNSFRANYGLDQRSTHVSDVAPRLRSNGGRDCAGIIEHGFGAEHRNCFRRGKGCVRCRRTKRRCVADELAAGRFERCHD